MSNSIVGGILDNDPKGKSGRGTKFWLEVTINEKLSRYEYFLLDVIEKKFDLTSVISEATQHIEAQRKAQELMEKTLKQEQLQKRKESITPTDELVRIIETVIENNPRPVLEYKSGKSKALNSLVGLVIKEVKISGSSIQEGAFAISTMLQQKLG